MKKLLPITLNNIKGFGPATISKLLKYNKLPEKKEDIFKWLKNNPHTTKNMIKKVSPEYIDNAISKANNIIEKSKENGIKIITILEKEYPEMFELMPKQRPIILYVKGNVDALYEPCIAIIGTTNPSEKGIRVGERLAEILASKYKYNIVSGLALGCDTAGHEGCLKAKGKTIAVMPCGLDIIYPASNKELANRIIENNGCLISEYPLGTKPNKGYFLKRDRLQSGLSKAVIVIESEESGGTMETVRCGLEQKRIIACYDEDTNIKTMEGNKKLINEEKAIAIRNPKDIKDLVDKIKNINLNKKSDDEDQLNLFSKV